MNLGPDKPLRLTSSRSDTEYWKMMLHQRERTIEDLRRQIDTLRAQIGVAERCLWLVGVRGPTGDTELDKALWMAWLGYEVQAPVMVRGTSHFDSLVQRSLAQSYDTLIDTVGSGLTA